MSKDMELYFLTVQSFIIWSLVNLHIKMHLVRKQLRLLDKDTQ